MSRPKRPALGRGLSSLIPETPKAPASAPAGSAPAGKPRELPIEAVEPNAEQPRKRFDEDALAELAESIGTHGIIQPIVVVPLPRVGGAAARYQILAGERRWRAAQLAGLKTVPVFIRETPEDERLELALIENLQRADLDPIEEAKAYAALLEQHGYTQAELASRVGKQRSTIANGLRLLKLPAKVQELLIDGQLGMGHARALLGLERESDMRELAAELIRRRWSVRQIEAEVRKRTTARKAANEPEPEPDDDRKRHTIIVRNLEERIRRHLGVQAKLRTGRSPKGPGTIELPYKDLDELQRLLNALLGEG